MSINVLHRRGQQLSGIRGVLIGVVVVGGIGFSVWSKLRPRTVATGTWEIEPGHFRADAINASQNSKMKVEFTPQGTADNYSIFVINAADQAKLTTADPDTITKLASQKGSGALTIPILNIGAGSYYVVALNEGTSKISVKFKITELRN